MVPAEVETGASRLNFRNHYRKCATALDIGQAPFFLPRHPGLGLDWVD
ncbi:hypothetical protein L0128_19575 [candidate division KSB1 bacterium]|nr:hypothetical protein [candidate division KSB1 bacterium]